MLGSIDCMHCRGKMLDMLGFPGMLGSSLYKTHASISCTIKVTLLSHIQLTNINQNKNLTTHTLFSKVFPL
jgi:hypothetical protein